jgi:glycosyltransferase involved in cell wall biosynthesis
MRVLINRYPALGLKTGVGHYTIELLRCLKEQAGPQIHVSPPDWLFRAEQCWTRARPYLELGADPRETDRPLSAAPPSARARAWKGLLNRGRAAITRYVCSAATRRCRLYHEPNSIPLPIDLPTVVTICDLSSLLHPEWHPRARVVEFERNFQRGLARCQHLLAISEYGRQEIIRTLNVSPQRVTCTYLGIRRGLQPLPRSLVRAVVERLGLPPSYLLYVGTLEPRKNLLTLLHAYCGLPAPLRERCPLLLAGRWGWKADAIAEFLDREGRARGVHHVGYVADAHLGALYNGARALVYPSLYEGFGLPPMEMLACGGAVLASTAGALVETVGKQAHLIAPEDVDGWRESMARVIADDDWWQQLRHGAEAAARPFTWERCAAETWQVYCAVCPELAGGRIVPAHSKAG